MKGIVVLQVDNSLALDTPRFLDEEEEAAMHFKTKEGAIITTATTMFNGVHLGHATNLVDVVMQQ